MITAKQLKFLISEANLTSSGNRANYDHEKYIKPYLPGGSRHTGDGTHEISSKIGEFNPGDRVTLHSHQIDDKGIHHVVVSKDDGNKITIPMSKLKKPKGKSPTYNDEHAHTKIWNYAIDHGIDTEEKLHQEIEKAKNDKNHPLHFSNAENDGFSGGKKTEDHKDSYHKELHTAVGSIIALRNHPKLKDAVKKGYRASVAGASKSKLSSFWGKYGASSATSKADLVLRNPNSDGTEGVRISMKKGGGSQLMSAGPEESSAVVHHATNQMLSSHPDYRNHNEKQRQEIHNDIMNRMKTVSKHLNNMKNASKEEQEEHRKKAQSILDKLHEDHPKLNGFVRREATTGEGKFEGPEGTASYLVKSGDNKLNASAKHVDELDHDGPPMRVALPKGNGRSGNIKLDEK